MGINECYFVVVLFCFDIYFVVSTLYEYILYDNFTTCVVVWTRYCNVKEIWS